MPWLQLLNRVKLRCASVHVPDLGCPLQGRLIAHQLQLAFLQLRDRHSAPIDIRLIQSCRSLQQFHLKLFRSVYIELPEQRPADPTHALDTTLLGVLVANCVEGALQRG